MGFRILVLGLRIQDLGLGPRAVLGFRGYPLRSVRSDSERRPPSGFGIQNASPGSNVMVAGGRALWFEYVPARRSSVKQGNLRGR